MIRTEQVARMPTLKTENNKIHVESIQFTDYAIQPEHKNRHPPTLRTATVVDCDSDRLWVMLGSDSQAKLICMTSCVSVR